LDLFNLKMKISNLNKRDNQLLNGLLSKTAVTAIVVFTLGSDESDVCPLVGELPHPLGRLQGFRNVDASEVLHH